MERQAELTQQAARLAHESQQRRHLEALLDEGLQVQNQILLGLQVLRHSLQHLLRCATCTDMPSCTDLQAMSYRLPCCDQTDCGLIEMFRTWEQCHFRICICHDSMCMLSRQPDTCPVCMHVTSIMCGLHVDRSW